MSSQLQHKLQQFEALPPKEIWQAIEERLMDDDGALQERLIAFEATPPVRTWQHIEASLIITDTEKKTPVVKMKWFRYAAAAAILGIVALSIFTFALNQPEKTIAQQPSYQNQAKRTDATQPVPQKNEVSSLDNNQVNNNSTTIAEKANTQSDLSNTLTSTTSKRYKVVAKEDGKLVRFSQKALAVFDCAVKATANKNVRCKENIQSMQEKMATSMVSPTADFAGLLDMIKTLEENK